MGVSNPILAFSILMLYGAQAVVFAESGFASSLPVSTGAKIDDQSESLRGVYLKLPIRFEPNMGQAAKEQKFGAEGEGYRIRITEDTVDIILHDGIAKTSSPYTGPARNGVEILNLPTLQLKLLKGRKHPVILGEQRQQSISNFFLGNDRTQWRSNVENFAAVRYQQVYPGIDWVIHGNPRQLEYDFVLKENASPSLIKLKMTGAEHLSIARNGDLLVQMQKKTLRQLAPTVYQTQVDGNRQRVEGHYVVRGDTVGFVLGQYDHSRELVIDPVLSYSTYLGGSTDDFATAIAVDSTGAAYVTGQTSSTDFPTTSSLQNVNTGNNAFVAKINAAGNALIYSTYLGGSGGDEARGIAVDGAGNAYITGWTFSRDFPLENPFQTTNKTSGVGSSEAFLTKLNATGSELIYSTYLGGSGTLNSAFAIAIDTAGDAYVVGDTNSVDFPTQAALQATNFGRLNAFVSKFDATGKTLEYSTYLGGTAADTAYGVAVDSADNLYVVGSTNSPDFPLANAYQNVNKAILNGSTNSTAFVSKLNSSGGVLLYSTYLGGTGTDAAQGVAVDSAGSAYITGQTCSLDFPVVNAFQAVNHSTCTAGPNAFVTKFNSSGRGIVYSTYLGGSGGGKGIVGDYGLGIAVDGLGNAYIVGATSSSDFPMENAVQSTNKAEGIGAPTAFISELNTGGILVFSTYLGGSGSFGAASVTTTYPSGDSAASVALDSQANIYVAGQTASADFPIVNAFQGTNKTTTTYGSSTNAFITKISSQLAAPTGVLATPSATQVVLSWSAVNGATSYTVYQGTSTDETQSVPVGTLIQGTTYTASSLTSGVTYYFEVTAIGANGESAKSIQVAATTTITTTTRGGGGAVDWGSIVILGFLVSRKAKTRLQ